MDPKTLHDFLFQMYDYADYIADKIEPNSRENNSYFLTLIYIEDIMDKYGRGLILSSADQANLNGHESLSEAHKRIDLLRKRIKSLSAEYNFNEALEQQSEYMLRDWRRPS